METFLVTYRVDFPLPRKPTDLLLSNFELVLVGLLTEETMNMKAAGEDLGGVHLGDLRGVKVREVGPKQREYVVRHSVRFETPGLERTHLRPPERLRLFLSEALGLTPRQYEGPWNITAISVARG